MFALIKSALFLTLIFAQHVVLAHRASPQASKALVIRADDNSYLNIVKGLLQSNKGNILRYISEIPCDEIQTLESDADAAKTFVMQLSEGQVPSIISNLPQEAVQEFSDVINIALSLPTEIINVAEAAATDAAHVIDDIEDGAIVQDIESLPGVILSDVTSGWADFTDGLTDAWDDVTSDIACFFAGCPEPTAVGSCAAAAASATTTGNTAAATTNNAAAATTSNTAAASTSTTVPTTTSNPAAATTQNAAHGTTPTPPQSTGATSLASTPSKWAGRGIMLTAVVVVLACLLHI